MQRAQVSNSQSALQTKFVPAQKTRLQSIKDCARYVWEKLVKLTTIVLPPNLGAMTISVNADINILPTLRSNVDSSSIEMPCNVSSHCRVHISNSYCIDKTCQCTRNHLLRNGNACVPVTASYCSTTDDCSDPESICIENRCQCRTSYVMRKSKCLPTKLAERCSKHSDCSEVKFAMCLNGQCVCIDKFFAVNATTCAKALGGSCITNKDCTVRFSSCFERICQCNRDYTQYSDSQCVAMELGTTCFDNSTCNLIRNAHCFENQCSCKDNHVEINAFTCSPLLNAICSDVLECAPTNSVCIDHKCQCKFSYFMKSNYECVLMYLEQRCRIDKDCIDIRFAKCSDAGKCVCHQNYVRTGPTTCSPTLGGYCTSNRECVTINAECSRYRCRCSAEYMQFSVNLCLPVFLGQKCNMDDDCNKISNAGCFNKKCQCRRGYTKFNHENCLPLIGASCTEHKECAVYNSNCVNNTCQCLETYVPQTQSQCLSTALDVICYSNNDCEILNTHCSRFQFCVCNKNFIAMDSKSCVTILEADCITNATCTTANSDCIENKCQCNQGFVRGLYNDCVSATLGDACATNLDCKNIPNAICIDKKCACKLDTFALTPSACTHLLNTNCSSSADCGIDASHCFENKCQCISDWTAITDTICAKRFELYYCNDALDCGEPWHSKCSQNRCVCNANHMAVNELTCLPILGGPCWKDDQCMTKNTHCIDFKCQCKPGFVSVATNMCVAS
ncbi:GSCOCG00010431001-RA-CDS [Cotesia congregata]|nr:GSCOCG00010431001-RA-CDS [Cotesia congregata]